MSGYGYQSGPYGNSSYGAGGAPNDYAYYNQQQQPQSPYGHPQQQPYPPQQAQQPQQSHPSQQPQQPQQPQHPGLAAPQPHYAGPQTAENISNGLSRLDVNASQPYISSHSSPSSAYTPHPGVEYSPAHGYYESPGGHPPPLNVAARRPMQPPQVQQPQASQPAPPQPTPPQHTLSQPPPQQSAPLNQSTTFFPGLPKLPFRSSNVPESDEERGVRLDRDRLAILGSSNFEDQLGWAQDALNWVDSALEQNARLTLLGQGRAETPAIEMQLRNDAVNVTEHMASQKHPRATFMKGMWLEFGKFGFPEDKRDAFEHFSRAARAGFARAEYRIGMQFEATGSPSQALQHYRAGEAAGDAASCYRMGMIHAMGQLNQPQDFARSVTLIRHAAENSDDNAPQGAYVYGMLLANDLPQIRVPEQLLPRDIVAGKRYIEKSAWLGFSKAQLKMASAYEVASLNCEVNPVLSMHYNALAAKQGEPEADMALSKWFVVGSESIFPKNERLAYMYAERAAGSGLPIAYFAMGYFNEVGAGTNPNLEIAKNWYQKAAAEGNAEASDALQRLSNNHQLSMQDHENVTISRIKSTHGSMRGPRPTRRPVNQMPTVPDEVAPPGGHYPQVANYVRPVGATPPPPRAGTTPGLQQTPPRIASVAPYPLEDGPRPVSSAPYPGADPRPSMPQHPADGYHGQPPAPGYPAGSQTLPYAQSYPMDPQGAARPHSAAPGGGPPQANAGYARPGPQQQPQSLYSGPVPSAHPPPMRNHQTPPQQYANQQQGPMMQPPRQPSVPPPAGYPPGPGPQPGGYAPMRPPKEPVAPVQNAPYQGPVPSHGPGPRPPPGSVPPQRMTPTPSLAPSNPTPRPGSSSGPPRHPSGPVPGPSSTPRPTSSTPSGSSRLSKPPQASQAGRPAGNTLQRPPGNGPKTFEQMGVPAAKNESECVVM